MQNKILRTGEILLNGRPRPTLALQTACMGQAPVFTVLSLRYLPTVGQKSRSRMSTQNLNLPVAGPI